MHTAQTKEDKECQLDETRLKGLFTNILLSLKSHILDSNGDKIEIQNF